MKRVRKLCIETWPEVYVLIGADFFFTDHALFFLQLPILTNCKQLEIKSIAKKIAKINFNLFKAFFFLHNPYILILGAVYEKTLLSIVRR